MVISMQDLQKLVKTKLEGYKFIVVSNREPYIHEYTSDGIRWYKPASGLAVALDPVMKSSEGTWIAYAEGEADAEAVDAQGRLAVPPDNPQFTLKRVFMTKEEYNGYYYGFSNQAMWPLCHIVYVRPNFDTQNWDMYVRANRKFADAILEEISTSEKAFVWLQDYHLTLAAKMIKEKRPDVIVSLFWHIPWPNPEAFRICPYKKEILEGLLANDLLGFHLRYHVENFMQTVDNTLETRIDRDRLIVHFQGHETAVQSFPISIDYEEVFAKVRTEEVKNESRLIRKKMASETEFIGVGVDRIDYTKGIPDKLRAIDRFFEKYPQYIKKFTFFQVGAPSRAHLRTYKSLTEDVSVLIEEINWKYSSGSWNPIVYIEKHQEFPDILAHYKDADVCIVSSLHDGMNLVAKEFVASQIEGDAGVLILSQFTGAARELTDALLINPFNIEEMADAIKLALEMPREEKERRMKNLQAIVKENNIYRWAGNIIDSIAKQKSQP